MSQVIRYVKISEYGSEIKESFINFLTVSEKTGIALAELITQSWKKMAWILKIAETNLMIMVLI